MKTSSVKSGVLSLEGDWTELHKLIEEKTGTRVSFNTVQFNVSVKKASPYEAEMKKYQFTKIGCEYTMEIDPFTAKLLAEIYGKDVTDEEKATEPIAVQLQYNSNHYKILVSFAKANKEGVVEYGHLSFHKFVEENYDDETLFKAIVNNFRPIQRLRSYKYLKNSLKYPPNSDQLTLPHEEEEFKPQYLAKIVGWDHVIPKASEFSDKFVLPIEPAAAIHIVEIFAENQSNTERTVTKKDFLISPKVYVLDLPYPIPVLFHADQVSGKINLYCKEFMGIPAVEIVDYVKFATKCICDNAFQQHVAKFYDVIPKRITQEELLDMEDELGVSFVRDLDTTICGTNNNNVFFSMYMIPSEFGSLGKQQVEAFRKYTEEKLFKKVAYYKCTVCGHMSDDNNACPMGQHIGCRIPFDDGSMSKPIEYLGIKTEQHRYECCGIVNVAFDEGCDKSTNHVMDPTMVFSEFTFM